MMHRELFFILRDAGDGKYCVAPGWLWLSRLQEYFPLVFKAAKSY